MGDTEDYEGQRLTTYHEAGHAVAAMKSGGRIESINTCDRNEDDQNGFTAASHCPADTMFRIYAGPWAEAAFLRGNTSLEPEEVFNHLRHNKDDWTDFQREAGNEPGDTDWMTLQHYRMNGGLVSIAEYWPGHAWHTRAQSVLTSAWDGIHDLAERLLSHQHVIDLPNGQQLIREESRDCWRGTNYGDAEDDCSGVVGPPPPIVHDVRA